MSPTIYTYAADNPETPAELRCLATLVLPGEPHGRWTAHAPTRELARAKLLKFWENSQPKPREPRKPKGGPVAADPVDDFEVI